MPQLGQGEMRVVWVCGARNCPRVSARMQLPARECPHARVCTCVGRGKGGGRVGCVSVCVNVGHACWTWCPGYGEAFMPGGRAA